MRENRQSGSEGREARKRAFLTPIIVAFRVTDSRTCRCNPNRACPALRSAFDHVTGNATMEGATPGAPC